MKKIALIIPLVIIISLITGCTLKKVAGEKLINNARDEFVKLKSGVVTVTDEKTGKDVQTLIFKCDSSGVMTYSYTNQMTNNKYLEYGNGVEYYDNKDGEIRKLLKGEKGFMKYTRQYPHPTASKYMIFFNKDSITEDTATETADGTTVTHKYDVKSFENVETGGGKLLSFEVIFNFDKKGKLIDFVEKSQIQNGDQKYESSYLIKITEQGKIETVENPFDLADLKK